jgi:hypothetical protein
VVGDVRGGEESEDEGQRYREQDSTDVHLPDFGGGRRGS